MRVEPVSINDEEQPTQPQAQAQAELLLDQHTKGAWNEQMEGAGTEQTEGAEGEQQQPQRLEE